MGVDSMHAICRPALLIALSPFALSGMIEMESISDRAESEK